VGRLEGSPSFSARSPLSFCDTSAKESGASWIKPWKDQLLKYISDTRLWPIFIEMDFAFLVMSLMGSCCVKLQRQRSQPDPQKFTLAIGESRRFRNHDKDGRRLGGQGTRERDQGAIS
jgi:hypothetical protein